MYLFIHGHFLGLKLIFLESGQSVATEFKSARDTCKCNNLHSDCGHQVKAGVNRACVIEFEVS